MPARAHVLLSLLLDYTVPACTHIIALQCIIKYKYICITSWNYIILSRPYMKYRPHPIWPTWACQLPLYESHFISYHLMDIDYPTHFMSTPSFLAFSPACYRLCPSKGLSFVSHVPPSSSYNVWPATPNLAHLSQSAATLPNPFYVLSSYEYLLPNAFLVYPFFICI